MRIITDKKALSEADIESALNRLEEGRRRKVELKRYYEGKHAILGKVGRKHDAPNNKLVSNYPAYITNMSTGFFIGQPISYKATLGNEEALETLLDIFKYNDEAAHNLALAEEASITGAAYEVLYIDSDAQIRMAILPAEEVLLISDSTLEGNIICAVRKYRVYGLDGGTYEEYVDVYDAENIRHYGYRGGLKLLSEERHYFGECPIIEYANNQQRRGDFEDVLTLIDAYNMAQSLTLDDMQDFTDAFLVLQGMGGTTPEDIKQLRKEKAILLEEGGGAQWLTKNINDAYIENVKTRLANDIHKFSNVPDMSDDNFASNASGVAIKYKLIGLEQIRGRKEREFKKALQRRIELMNNILKLQSKVGIDFRDVSMTFTANIPANLPELVQIVNQLDGLVDQETLLGLLPFVEEPEQVMKNEKTNS